MSGFCFAEDDGPKLDASVLPDPEDRGRIRSGFLQKADAFLTSIRGKDSLLYARRGVDDEFFWKEHRGKR